jgi:hypothetical protein
MHKKHKSQKIEESKMDLLRNVWSAVLDGGWALWHEVEEGASRLSWWVLVGLVWLDGLALGWWLWNH